MNEYLSDLFFTNASRSEISDLLAMYPEDPTKGSPFNTGAANALTPQFKRVAAILGDVLFEAPRKLFLDAVVDKQNVWTFGESLQMQGFLRLIRLGQCRNDERILGSLDL